MSNNLIINLTQEIKSLENGMEILQSLTVQRKKLIEKKRKELQEVYRAQKPLSKL